MLAHKGKSMRAMRLLVKLVTNGSFTSAALARELRITDQTLLGYMSGAQPIPLDRQVLLASLAIEKVPALARMGYSLRGQVLAALAYERRETATHLIGPVARFK